MMKLQWDAKEECLLEHTTPTDKQFIINEEKSINFDKTNNVIIEGDNLDVLKLLQSEYQSKVKMIYIDPPYNTGNKGLYKDKYWKARECKHSAWLSMMYPRLKLARELLRDDGVIFVSIDDHEQATLKLLMDEIFGEDMFIRNVIWEKTYSPQNMNKFISCNHDYISIYRKSKSLEKFTGLPRAEKQNIMYKNIDNDPRGDWKSGDFSCMGKNNIYPITNPIGKIIYPPEGRSWKFSKEKYEKLKQDNRIWFGKDGNATPCFKLFLNEAQQHIVTQTIWRYENVGHTDGNTKQLKTIFNGKAVFDFPKGTKLITKMLQISTSANDLILDFFAGSGTTGHAVMEMNLQEKNQAIDNGEDPELVGNRKYIMVQLPEQIDEKTDAYKAGYKTISDITIDRIKRVGTKISEENADVKLDLGFKVFDLT